MHDRTCPCHRPFPGLARLAVALAAALVRATAPAAEDPPAWSPVAGLEEIQGLFASPVEPGVVYAADAKDLWRSMDAGRSFVRCGPCAARIVALLIDPLDPRRLYAGTEDQGVRISEDQGQHWHASGPGLASQHIAALQWSSTDRTCATLYASHGDQPGLSQSSDGGASWHSFAQAYSIGQLVVMEDAIFCAGTNAAQGSGFFRCDATKGWYCVLPEVPRVVLSSPEDGQRLWFSSRDAGISTSGNAGISTSKVGPPDCDVEAMAIDPGANGHETVFAFAPHSAGVLCSEDCFATWIALTRGLEPSDWIKEGARLAVSCDGGVLYASANGAVYRLERRVATTGIRISLTPAVLAAGAGPVLILAHAPPGSQLVADCSSLGIAAPVPLHDDGQGGDAAADDGIFSARLDQVAASVPPGLKVVTVQRRGAESDALPGGGHGGIRLVPQADDALLWDASRQEGGGAQLHGAWVGERTELPGSHTPVLHVHCDGQGSLRIPLANPTGESVNARSHALITFGISSSQPGPLAWTLCVHDNGQGSGSENTQSSQVVAFTRYLPLVDQEVREVSIPIAELLEGSTCSPVLIDLTITAGEAVHRDINLLPIRLLAQSGPSLADLQVVPRPDGILAVSLSARGRGVRPDSASVRFASDEVPLKPSASPAASAPSATATPTGSGAGVAALATDREDLELARFTGLVPGAKLPPGPHTIAIRLHDAHGTTVLTAGFQTPP